MRKISVLALALIISTAILMQWNPISDPKGTRSVQALVVVPRLYVDPPIIDDPTKGVGTNFTININIANAENLYGWQVNMTYNPEVLFTSETSMTEGPFLLDTFGDTVFLSSVANATGYLLVAGMAYPPYPDAGAYGDGTLASITFQVIAEERGTPLQFVKGTKLRTVVEGNVIPIENFVTEDGFFDNRTTNMSPVAAFYVVSPEPEVGDTVAFIASASYDLDGWLDSYHWDYGDNQSQIYVRNVNLTSQTTHVYLHAGICTVTLTVTDNDGLTASSQEIVKVGGPLIILITPKQGIVGTTVALTGVGAIPNDTVNIYWSEYIYDEYWQYNYTLIGTAATDSAGNFSTFFQVPQSTYGYHNVMASCPTSMTYYVELFFVLPSITVDPTSGPVGTKITVSGTGFPVPYTYSSFSAYLFFDNQDFTLVMSDEKGNMQATINAPIAAPGPHTVRALIMYYSYPTQPGYFTPEATFTIIDTTPLDLTADVGSIYFKGETAEVTVQTAFKGAMTNATSVKAKLQKPDGSTETLPVESIATGLYRIRYLLNGKGSMMGAYTIVIEANYTTDTITAFGTTIKTFLVKSTWEKEVPRIAAFSLASIGLISAMVVLWRKEKKRYL
jgi:PKD repeat protein